jgi:acyl carrier protein
MMLQEIRDKVFLRVAAAAHVPLVEVKLDSALAALGIDSISVVEIVIDLEEDLCVDVAADMDESLEDGVIETVGQLVDYVSASATRRAAGRSAS